MARSRAGTPGSTGIKPPPTGIFPNSNPAARPGPGTDTVHVRFSPTRQIGTSGRGESPLRPVQAAHSPTSTIVKANTSVSRSLNQAKEMAQSSGTEKKPAASKVSRDPEIYLHIHLLPYLCRSVSTQLAIRIQSGRPTTNLPHC